MGVEPSIDIGALARSAVNGSSAHRSIREYAAIGDGRTVALVALDGTIDWLCLPNLDSPSAFGALLDTQSGGCFALAPDAPFDVSRRYVPSTNVLETTFETARGSVLVTDAMTLPDGGGLPPGRELCRRIDVLSGKVPMRWVITPRFGYGQDPVEIGQRQGVPVATAGNLAMAVNTWNAGVPLLTASSIEGRFIAETDAMVALSVASQEPLVFPDRDDVERRLESTTAYWRDYARASTYAGRWRDAVERSALALKLLVFAPSGALSAAATTSLPETLGGERNWDYRFCWPRDAAFTLSSFFHLGYALEAESFFWWLMHASQRTEPFLDVLYRLDGGTGGSEWELPLAGFAGSRPVRVGNAAARQTQLDVYGEVLQTAWTYASAGYHIDHDIGRRLGRIADLVCDQWRRPDAGIWEVRSRERHFTHSKMMCWIALDRAIGLARPGDVRGRVERWTSERDAIESFIESRCWSDAGRSYARAADGRDLDAAVLLGAVHGYREANDPRIQQTIEAIERELVDGPFVQRYSGEDGLTGDEGAFLPCSFWLVEALARSGRTTRATELMAELISLANDVGLYAEEIHPINREFLGNFPQALTHLALIGAAVALEETTA